MSLYSKQLLADGVPQQEVDRRREVILRVVGSKELTDSEFSRTYGAPGNEVSRVTPSAWLVQVTTDIKPGKALDVGMGQGRNSLFLARKGWDVTGVDHSEVAVGHAREEALKAGVRYAAITADLHKFDFGRNRWDLIAAIYMPDRWVKQIYEGLKPRGLFVREHVIGFTAKGDDKEQRKQSLAKLYQGLEIVHYEEVLDPVGGYTLWEEQAARVRTNPARVARLTATKT
jgi:2-polyprenyl-3-methyl-5-hydroxy-6-metoxy-1,4-benzoquinol methylase